MATVKGQLLACPICGEEYATHIVAASPETSFLVRREGKDVIITEPAYETYVKTTALKFLSGHLTYTHGLKGEKYKEAKKAIIVKREWEVDDTYRFNYSHYVKTEDAANRLLESLLKSRKLERGWTSDDGSKTHDWVVRGVKK